MTKDGRTIPLPSLELDRKGSWGGAIPVNLYKVPRSACSETPRGDPAGVLSSGRQRRELTVGQGWTTAMPYGLLPVAMVAVVLKVLGSMTDSVFAPWLAT